MLANSLSGQAGIYQVFQERSEAGDHAFPRWQIFFPLHPGARRVSQVVTGVGTIGMRNRSGTVYGGGFAVNAVFAMLLITILNHCHRFPGFIYQSAKFSTDKRTIEVQVRPRRGSAAVCSGCHQRSPGYDHSR